jgi:adenylyltransferase/sulfurtransferase
MNDEQSYFARQRLLPSIDIDRLRASTVMVCGLGNIGGPVALELGRAGIGRLTLVDKDVVAAENHSRGIFRPRDIGKTKVAAAAERLAEDAPYTHVTPLCADLRFQVGEGIFSAYDAIVIVTDNWSSRMHANRWAHALPGRVKVVVSGGMTGISWTVVSSVPGSGLGCAQCPHGPDIARAHEEGGCGVVVREGVRRADPSTSFIGVAVAAEIVHEVVSALGGKGPRFAGKMVSYDDGRNAWSVHTIMPDPECTGHRRLAEYEEYMAVPVADYQVRDLVALAAREMRVELVGVTLASEWELLSALVCTVCRHRTAVHRPLLLSAGIAATTCPRCGSTALDATTHTVLEGGGKRLSELGIAVGGSVLAYAADRQVRILQLEEGR